MLSDDFQNSVTKMSHSFNKESQVSMYTSVLLIRVNTSKPNNFKKRPINSMSLSSLDNDSSSSSTSNFPLLLERPVFIQRIVMFHPKINQSINRFFELAQVSQSWYECLLELGSFEATYPIFSSTLVLQSLSKEKMKMFDSFTLQLQAQRILSRCFKTERIYFLTKLLRQNCIKTRLATSDFKGKIRGIHDRLLLNVEEKTNIQDQDENQTSQHEKTKIKLIDVMLREGNSVFIRDWFGNKQTDSSSLLTKNGISSLNDNPSLLLGGRADSHLSPKPLCLAFSHDDKRIAVGYGGANVRLFDTSTGVCTGKIMRPRSVRQDDVLTMCFHPSPDEKKFGKYLLYFTVVASLCVADTSVVDTEPDFFLSNEDEEQTASSASSRMAKDPILSVTEFHQTAKCYQMNITKIEEESDSSRYFLVVSNFHGLINVFDVSSKEMAKKPVFLRQISTSLNPLHPYPWSFCFASPEFSSRSTAAAATRNKATVMFAYASRQMTLRCYDLITGGEMMNPIQVAPLHEDVRLFHSAKIDISDDGKVITLLASNLTIHVYRIQKGGIVDNDLDHADTFPLRLEKMFEHRIQVTRGLCNIRALKFLPKERRDSVGIKTDDTRNFILIETDCRYVEIIQVDISERNPNNNLKVDDNDLIIQHFLNNRDSEMFGTTFSPRGSFIACANWSSGNCHLTPFSRGEFYCDPERHSILKHGTRGVFMKENLEKRTKDELTIDVYCFDGTVVPISVAF